MVDFRKCIASLAVVTLLAQPLAAAPLSHPRLFPEKSVALLETGTTVDSEMPAPGGVLMACNGQCFIEADGVQLMGADKTVFAVHEEEEAFFVLVETGSVSFAVRADAKPVEFTTPFDSFRAKPALIPASSDAVIRGTLDVTESRAVLTMTEGSLELANAEGHKLLKAGNSIVLAKAPFNTGLSAAENEALSGIAVGTATLAIIGTTIAALAGGGGGSGEGGDDGDGKDVSPK